MGAYNGDSTVKDLDELLPTNVVERIDKYKAKLRHGYYEDALAITATVDQKIMTVWWSFRGGPADLADQVHAVPTEGRGTESLKRKAADL